MFDDNADPTITITFRLPADLGASSAAVVGDFNNWDSSATPMERAEDGSFTTSVEVPTGRTYQYRYLVDGDRWENDWNADAYAVNTYGGDDSVLDLTEGSSRMAASTSESSAPSAVEPPAAAKKTRTAKRKPKVKAD